MMRRQPLFCLQIYIYKAIHEGKTMRRKEKKNTYCILSAILCGVMLIGCSAEGGMTAERTGQNKVSERAQDEKQFIEGEEDLQRPGETYRCSMQELTSYLLGYVTDCPYVSADITINGYSGESSYNGWNNDISFAGDAEVTWQFYDSLEQMEDALQARVVKTDKSVDEAVTDNAEGDANDSIRLIYYAFPLPEDAHALDIYQTLEERFGTEEQPVVAVSGDRGRIYYFIRETATEDGYTHLYMHKSPINLVVKDRYAYGLVFQNVPSSLSDEELHVIYMGYMSGFGSQATSGSFLNDERLYWIDHEERVTVMEEPDRSFVEIRGVDKSWEGTGEGGIMVNFGLLKEADYEVPLTEDGPRLQIHFSFAADSLETAYETYLIQGLCEDANYHMTVMDKESGKVLQEDVVELCIELPDTITFEDLNADDYVDMFIDKPLHSNSSRAVASKYSDWYFPSYMLWNPQKQRFESKTKKEVNSSLLANQNEPAEEERREYVVQPGDCLWSISERFLGSGFNWTMLQREENAPEDPDYLLPGEIIRIPEKIYIPGD